MDGWIFWILIVLQSNTTGKIFKPATGENKCRVILCVRAFVFDKELQIVFLLLGIW